MKKKSIFLIVIPFIITGCVQNTSTPLQNSVRPAANNIISNNIANTAENNYVEEFNDKMESIETRIENIENAITKMYGIKTANVLILENAAIVSISLDEGIGNPSVPTIRRDIEYKVRQIDPHIEHVSVSASAEIVEKLNDIRSQSKNKNDSKEIITNLRPPI
ncbi:MAG: YhcN/YlaJ family sporulation lipoprotein [Defluviitaleaceae bacterium]|nr:YhcN/YlaJ family sporulation lipoprotein [Defluviitaleaceae bacterium]